MCVCVCVRVWVSACVCVPGFQCGCVSVSALSVCLSLFHSMPVDRCMEVCRLPVTVYAAVIQLVCMSMPTHFGFGFTRAM